MKFVDRIQAGQQLAAKLELDQLNSAVVLALPRGGVLVGFQIAQQLNLPLDVLVVRKIGAPGNPEYGLGAIAEQGVQILDQERLTTYGINQAVLDATIKQEQAELRRRCQKYRPDRELPNLSNQTVVLVDDGVATGVTVRVAIKLLRDKLQAKVIILAIPVCATDTAVELKSLVDEFICLYATPHLYTIGQFYQYFDQTSDEQVVSLLAKARELS